jgi:alpha-glucosidase (family GH31 glycosyl hydrolase)
MLVAPITRPKTFERLVYLPEGNWYHESSKKWYAGSASYIVEAKRDDIPVFTRAGSMRLVNKAKEYIDDSFEEHLELHVYHGGDQVKRFYFDDGISYDYQKSGVGIIEVRVEGDKVIQTVIQEGYRLPKIEIVEISL